MMSTDGVKELSPGVFTTYDQQQNCSNLGVTTTPVKVTEPFPILNYEEVEYWNFYEEFLIRNRPCLFTNSITTNWNACTDWVDRSQVPAKINFSFIKNVYGSNEVTVVECPKYEPNFKKDTLYNVKSGEGEVEMTVSEYLDYLENYSSQGHPANMKCYYLKDWHILQHSESYVPYVTPVYFQSDWLNEVWGIFDDDDDFIFCYIGPKGSWTPFHCDVYGSFSWSANVIGTKLWRIYPPGGENQFKNPVTGKLKYDYANPGVKDVDYYEVVQKAGEVIFIPSGWHHCVWNIEDTVSINHNWMNAANILYIWSKLQEALKEVKAEMADCRDSEDFADMCQRILKVNHGLDYPLFLSLLQTIEDNRITNGHTIGPTHCSFDQYVLNTLQQILSTDSDVNEL